MRTFRSALIAAAVLSVTLSTLGGGTFADASESPSGDEIVAKVNARDDGDHVTRKVTMEMIDRRGKTRERETFGYRKYFGEDKKTVIFYLSPSNIKDTGFLTFDYADEATDDDQWLYLPAARRVRRISSADRGDYFLGTDFTYEDIKKESKFSATDYTHTAIGEEEIDGHHCYILEAIPVDEATAKELGYGKVQSWVDSEIWMARKSEFWDIRMNPLKTTRTTDILEIDGIWTATRIEIDNHKTGHKTVFKFDDIDYQSAVDEDVFTERARVRERGGPRSHA